MMRSPVVTALLAALLAPALGAQDPPKQTQMTLAAKVPNPKAKRPLLRFDGGIPVPDMTVLFVSVSRSQESWNGDRLEPTYTTAGGSMAQVMERKFTLESPIDGSGLFSVRVDLRDELQNPQIIDSLKKTPVDPKSWRFDFSAWSDDLPTNLAAALMELDLLGQDAGVMVRKYETACKTEQGWLAAAKELTAENAKLLKRCESTGLRAYYPAALNQIHYTVRNLQGNSPYFSFVDGKFSGATSYHADNQKVKTFRNEDFTYENFKRYIAESTVIAGREFALWIVKDFRRAGNQSTADAVAAVTQMKDHPGVAEFLPRLNPVKADDVDALDKDIRGAKLGPGAPAPEKDAKK
jgi:hypothetical protein